MDLTRPVAYRGVQLNDARQVPGSSQLTGIAVEHAVLAAVQGVGYTEKRSLADGRDASDVYLESRRIALSGTIYGLDRASAFDLIALLRVALSPTGAYQADPGDYGYLPLSWQEPTNDTRFAADSDSGVRYRDLHANARPVATPEFDVVRDRLGGKEDRGTGIPWMCHLEAIDPRIYGSTLTTYLNTTGSTTKGSGTFVNRGGYPAPVKLLFVVPKNQPKPGFAKFTIGGSIMRITIPVSPNDQTYRYDGVKKILTVEEAGLEVLRMDELVFLAESTHPFIPSGTTNWSWTTVPSEVPATPPPTTNFATQPIGSNPGSRIWFDEGYV